MGYPGKILSNKYLKKQKKKKKKKKKIINKLSHKLIIAL